MSLANIPILYGTAHRIGQAMGTNGSVTTFSLNAAAVHGTSGPEYAMRFTLPEGGTVTEAYFYCSAIGGTLANITMRCRVYNDGGSSTRPGTTLQATADATVKPSAAAGWWKFTFSSPYTATAGDTFWVIFDNTSSVPATDYPQTPNSTIISSAGESSSSLCLYYSNASGFSTNGTLIGEGMGFIKLGSIYFGNTLQTYATTYYTSNQLTRGLRIKPPYDCDLISVNFAANSAYSWLDLYDDSTAPGGTKIASWQLDTVAGNAWADQGVRSFAAQRLTAGTWYKLCFRYASASQLPAVLITPTIADIQTPIDSMANGWGWMPSVIDNGAGGWTIVNGVSPCMRMLVTPVVSGTTLVSRRRRKVY